MKKIEKLKVLIGENGSSREMKRLVFFVGKCMEKLEQAFAYEELSLKKLENVLNMFFEDLNNKKVFEGKTGVEADFYMMSIFFVVRHTWHFVDKNGRIKNGDDLNKVAPFHFAEEKTLELESLYIQMGYLYFI